MKGDRMGRYLEGRQDSQVGALFHELYAEADKLVRVDFEPELPKPRFVRDNGREPARVKGTPIVLERPVVYARRQGRHMNTRVMADTEIGRVPLFQTVQLIDKTTSRYPEEVGAFHGVEEEPDYSLHLTRRGVVRAGISRTGLQTQRGYPREAYGRSEMGPGLVVGELDDVARMRLDTITTAIRNGIDLAIHFALLGEVDAPYRQAHEELELTPRIPFAPIATAN